MSPAVTEPQFSALLALPVVRRLAAESRGVPCHLVGGVLRDHVLGRPPRDLDAVVSENGLSLARRLADSLPARLVELGGDRFAAYRLVGRTFTLDLWDRRGETLEADLTRRDFTINSCALDLETGKIADPLGGLADLENRVLRASSVRAFELDPLRTVRLPRFLAQLGGFSVEPETGRLAARAVVRIARIAVERVREELELLFAGESFSAAAPWLVELGLHPGLWTGAPGTETPTGGYGDLVSCLEALLDRLQALGIPSFVPGEAAGETLDRAAARLAITFLDLPLPDPAPNAEEAETVETPTRRLAEARRVGLLKRGMAEAVSRLLLAPLPLEDEPRRRWYLHRLGRLWREGLACIGARQGARLTSSEWLGTVSEIEELARRAGSAIFSPPALLSGHEVAETLDLEPGPELGSWVERLRRAQIENRFETRGEAKEWLRRALSERS